MAYGAEVIVDLHDCDPSTFTRDRITRFFVDLCDRLGMERHDLHFWDDHGVAEPERQTEAHLKGTSAVQFIMTSTVTIHALDLLRAVYLNVFSCGAVDENIVVSCAVYHFGGRVVNANKLERS